MLHIFMVGLLLGYGAALPIGAINLEMIRRNLRFSTLSALMLGIGACFADLTYLVLLSFGVLQILHHPLVLKITGIIGAFILAWFGYKALQLKSAYVSDEQTIIKNKPAWRDGIEGYLLTLINPYTIVFWSSVSMTIASLTQGKNNATIVAGLGVLAATFSWACGLNLFLHFTKHRLSKRVIHLINICGGLILLSFAGLGLWRAFFNS